MLLSEAKAQAQVLLNEAFYAYHAHEEPLNDMYYGHGVHGTGVYLLLSQDPKYKGMKNGQTWMTPGERSFGRYVHKCKIAGELDKNVYHVNDFTFSKVSHGQVKNFFDIKNFLKENRSLLPDSVFYGFLKIEKMLVKPTVNFVGEIKDLSSQNNNESFRFMTKLCKIVDDYFASLLRIMSRKDEKYLNNHNKFYKNAYTLYEILHKYNKIHSNIESSTLYEANCKDFCNLLKTYFHYNFSEKDLKEKVVYTIRQNIDKIAKDIVSYIRETIDQYISYCIQSNDFFRAIMGRPEDYYSLKTFFRKYGIIGLYEDQYNIDVTVEEVVIWDIKDVEIVSVKDIGLRNYSAVRNAQANGEQPYDKNGHLFNKFVQYDYSRLPRQNSEFQVRTAEGRPGVDENTIEIKNKQKQFKNGIWQPIGDYTTKNPYYRTGSWSFKQPNKNTGNLK